MVTLVVVELHLAVQRIELGNIYAWMAVCSCLIFYNRHSCVAFDARQELCAIFGGLIGRLLGLLVGNIVRDELDFVTQIAASLIAVGGVDSQSSVHPLLSGS